MSLIRARLIVCAFALLLCQSAALASAPIALFRGAMFGDADECCRNLKPGQMCPMHHRTHDSSKNSGPAWKCPCAPSDVVLTSLVLMSVTLSESARVPNSLARAAVVAVVEPPTLNDQTPPPYHPPRA